MPTTHYAAEGEVNHTTGTWTGTYRVINQATGNVRAGGLTMEAAEAMANDLNTTGPTAALHDTLQDMEEALDLLRRCQDRIERFLRLPCSAFTFQGIKGAVGSVSMAVIKLREDMEAEGPNG